MCCERVESTAAVGHGSPVNLPLLAPHAQLAWRDSNHLILEDPAAPQTQVLVGNATPATARWLRSCDGTHTLGDLLASAAAVGIDPTSAAFTASPIAANGKLFVTSEDGDTFVIQPGPEFKVLGKNSLNEFVMATPAAAGDSLYIRSAGKVFKIAAPARR